MKASQQINDGASTFTAGETEAMQLDDAFASISTLVSIDIDYVQTPITDDKYSRMRKDSVRRFFSHTPARTAQKSVLAVAAFVKSALIRIKSTYDDKAPEQIGPGRVLAKPLQPTGGRHLLAASQTYEESVN
ncbi:hypothetical protein EVAR_69140_1 [Eumeta japonica]|uniref:Uncharacterized protein n=1 Tax=Eumeta variegata TaxID=151549 RepID=A0A4C2A2R2_EUMVA|nr:hypothetical protein EVAR_69140_1 [Eumeta japonica]